MRVDFRRWGKFKAVGLGGFFVQIYANALLTRQCGWPAFAATAVALEIAALPIFWYTAAGRGPIGRSRA